jgi:UDP-N-acetylglucosamine 2-epimerase (non-hydrolysing)
MKKIFLVIGTRPEAIKMIPVFLQLKRKKCHVMLISTGQHKEMLKIIFDFFGVQPDHDMGLMVPNQTLTSLTALLISHCSALFERESPDMVIVQGDTTSAFAAALSAFYLKIPVAHVEAGLRSYDIFSPYPEEVNRRNISTVAQLHFAPTRKSARVLKDEKVQGKVHTVGNTVIDSLLLAQKKVSKQRKMFYQEYEQFLVPFDKMVLITGHRRESFGKGFESICVAIKKLSEKYPQVSWVYPVHLNPNVHATVGKLLSGLPNVFLIEPVPYPDMIFLMSECSFILTDSGGIQEEAPSFNKPVIVMRNTTERMEGVEAGCSVLTGTDSVKIIRYARMLLVNYKAYRKMSCVQNPYGKGDSAGRIARYVLDFLSRS